MSLIICSKKCIYQKNGYCRLEIAATVTNASDGCPHFMENKKMHGDYISDNRKAKTSLFS